MSGVSLDDDESKTLIVMDKIAAVLYPILRLVAAFAVVWFCSTFSK